MISLFSGRIGLERGRENSSFPVEESIENRGFSKSAKRDAGHESNNEVSPWPHKKNSLAKVQRKVGNKSNLFYKDK